MVFTADDKVRMMSEIGIEYAVITAAEEEVKRLKEQAAPKIKAVVDAFGAGLHRMTVPTPDGSSKEYIVSFRKVGDRFNTHVVPIDAIT